MVGHCLAEDIKLSACWEATSTTILDLVYSFSLSPLLFIIIIIIFFWASLFLFLFSYVFVGSHLVMKFGCC